MCRFFIYNHNYTLFVVRSWGVRTQFFNKEGLDMFFDIYRDHLDYDKPVDPTRSYAERNFYAPKKRVSKLHVQQEKFVSTVKDVFARGGNYADVANELMITPSAVYSRVKKLKAAGDTSLPAISVKSRDTADEAVSILNELGLEVDYAPVDMPEMNASVAGEANDILKELGLG
jgi:transposase-like protein